MNRINLYIKRVFDVTASLVLLVILSPVFLFLLILIWLTLGKPVIFAQKRLGYNGKEFNLFKFRTMTTEQDEQGNLLPDGERMTKLGRFLRKTSLDEIPEFFNVILGDMSAIGPRPLLVEYRDLYTSEQWRRHDMRPGMAGPVIADGRNLLTWEEKFTLDIWYVDNWSLLLDMRILFKTIISVLNARGINQPGQATVDYFKGTKED